MPAALPIDPFVPDIVTRVRSRRAVVLSAPPGAGKTTRVPPALAVDGPVIVLQPRRIAARSIAQRIASEHGWTIGEEVGWQVRFEKRFTARTRVLLATEGILTARLQFDPLLTDFNTVVLDEFHERTVHADLGLALARQAWLARDDLRIVVMSATLDTGAVASFLGGCPVIDIPVQTYPLEIEYAPGESVAATAGRLLDATGGSVLCFLPGAGEIARELSAAGAVVPGGVEILPLYGSLPPEEQDRAMEVAPRPRVILATNIAETSLTVPRVTAVVDTGLHKVARYDPDRAVDSLDLERIPRDSATQRAGRAGRLGPGRVVRLWNEHDRLRPHGEPEIRRVDLSDAALQILAWGGNPRRFDWFDPPPDDAIDGALRLLERLGVIRDGAITALGRQLQDVSLHPRLARMLVEGRCARTIALAAALLSERRSAASHPPSTSSDLLSAVQDERRLPPHVVDVARRLSRHTRISEDEFLRAVFSGYPDRVGRRRSAGSPRFQLSSGHGAVLTRDSGVHDAEFIVALDVQAGERGQGSEARIRMASAVDPAWLIATDVRLEHTFDERTGAVRAVERSYYDALVIREASCPPEPQAAARLLAAAYLDRPRTAADEQLLRRIRFAGVEADEREIVARAVAGRRSLADVRLADGIDPATRRQADRLAPQSIRVPSGRTAALEYLEDGSVRASVKLQELFGLADTPRVGARGEPVLLLLLAPNGRPVQTTRDLRSFWNTTYPEVRRELRARYPKHPWPEDPWTATPTARAKRRT